MCLSPHQIALRARMPRYMGRPCTKGHSGLRYTANYKCVTCDLESGRKRASKHRRKNRDG